MAQLELRGVTKRFGKVQAVDNVSLSVDKGEILSLLDRAAAVSPPR